MSDIVDLLNNSSQIIQNIIAASNLVINEVKVDPTVSHTKEIDVWITSTIGILNAAFVSKDPAIKDQVASLNQEITSDPKTDTDPARYKMGHGNYTDLLQNYEYNSKKPFELVQAKVYNSVGDGTCLIHSFLDSICLIYRQILDRSHKSIIGRFFRKYVFAELFNAGDPDEKRLKDEVLELSVFLNDLHIIKLSDTFNVNIMIYVNTTTVGPDNKIQKFCPKCSGGGGTPGNSKGFLWILIFKYNSSGHFDSISLRNAEFLLNTTNIQSLLNDLPDIDKDWHDGASIAPVPAPAPSSTYYPPPIIPYHDLLFEIETIISHLHHTIKPVTDKNPDESDEEDVEIYDANEHPDEDDQAQIGETTAQGKLIERITDYRETLDGKPEQISDKVENIVV